MRIDRNEKSANRYNSGIRPQAGKFCTQILHHRSGIGRRRQGRCPNLVSRLFRDWNWLFSAP
jgi:hypothetical protein